MRSRGPGWARLLRFGSGYPRFLSHPLTIASAREAVQRRLEERAPNFLRTMRAGIYDHPRSPYRPLLRQAGCDYADLEASVRRHGIEATLTRLREAGVTVSLSELRGRTAIERPDLHLTPQPEDFDRPRRGERWIARTSGSTGRRLDVPYGWDFLADECADEMLLFESAGLLGAPGAFWMPSLPSVSGAHNLLLHVGFRQPPEAWLTPLAMTRPDRFALHALRATSLAAGLRLPFPRLLPLTHAEAALHLLQQPRWHGRPRYLKAFTSWALRVAQAAIAAGHDLTGLTFLCGGEPMTRARRRYLESTGARVVPRYVTTESGLVAGGCADPHPDAYDAMHVYEDRLAVIAETQDPGPLLFTTLLPSAGKILLNADLGDIGVLEKTRCDCVLGRSGFRSGLSQVRSRERHTSEGMSLTMRELAETVEHLVVAAGGSPADSQLATDAEPAESETSGSAPLDRIAIRVHPRVPITGERFLEDLYRDFANRGGGWSIVAHTWEQAGTLRVVREEPRVSEGGKLLPRISAP